jgi:hypothetical protein
MEPEEHEIVATEDDFEEMEEWGDPYTRGKLEGSNVTPA